MTLMKSTSVVLALLLVGCSGDTADRVAVYQVTGTITMGGAPVPNANVTFSPLGQTPVALGRTDANGAYTLTTYDAGDGAAPGDYAVMVSKSGGAGGAPSAPVHGVDAPGTPPSAMHGEGGAAASGSDSLLPEKFGAASTTTLNATVTNDPSKNVFDFSLD